MYLLNIPTKKSKYKKYERQNKKLLKMIGEENTQEAIEKENKSTLDKIKDDIDR